MSAVARFGLKDFALAAAIAAIVGPTAAVAQQPAATDWVQLPQVRLRLVAGAVAGTDKSSTRERILLVEMSLQPTWKTYWRMPGDAGIPPSFDWTGSKNVGEVEVRYPAPSIYVDQAGRTVGYKDEVTFPIVLRPSDMKAPSEIRVELAFGICREICIPVETKVSLDVPPAATLPAARITEAMSKVPSRKKPAEAARGAVAISSVALHGGAGGPKLSLKTAGVETVLIEAPDGLFVPIPQRVAGNEMAATFEVDLAKSQDLPDLKGKSLTITAIGRAGAIETTWMMPQSF